MLLIFAHNIKYQVIMDEQAIMIEALRQRVNLLESKLETLTQLVTSKPRNTTRTPQVIPIAFADYYHFVSTISDKIVQSDIQTLFALQSCEDCIGHILECVFTRSRYTEFPIETIFPIYIAKNSHIIFVAKIGKDKQTLQWERGVHGDLVKLFHAIQCLIITLLDLWRDTHSSMPPDQYNLILTKIYKMSYGESDPIFGKMRQLLKRYITI